MINYVTTKVLPQVDPLSNEVHSWVFGITGTDSETDTSAYFDAVWDVSSEPLLRYMMWSKEAIDLELGKCTIENDMDAVIARKIAAKDAKKLAVNDFNYNALS